MTKPVKAPRINQATMRRALRLLNMQYRPSEIADELHVGVNTIYRSWIPSGLPCSRDERGQIWIIGTELQAWLASIAATRRAADA